MKIAIATDGRTLRSSIDPRFGRCPYFLIVDSETNEFEVVKNKADRFARGVGISTSQMVANKGVKAVFAGNFGPNAINVLSSNGIKVFGGLSGMKAKKALEQFQKGKLKEMTASVTPFGPGGGGRARRRI